MSSVIFSDSFALENVQVKDGKNGEYFDSPKRKVRTDKKQSGYEYAEYFHPITAEAYNELRNSIVDSLNAQRANNRNAAMQNVVQQQDDVLDMTGQNRGRGI